MRKEKTSAEQRRHPRSPLGVTFDLRLTGDGSACRATIDDVSEGGMTIKTDAALEKGMTLHLSLSPSLRIRGEVRHAGALIAGQRRYGLRFHKVGYFPAI